MEILSQVEKPRGKELEFSDMFPSQTGSCKYTFEGWITQLTARPQKARLHPEKQIQI